MGGVLPAGHEYSSLFSVLGGEPLLTVSVPFPLPPELSQSSHSRCRGTGWRVLLGFRAAESPVLDSHFREGRARH